MDVWSPQSTIKIPQTFKENQRIFKKSSLRIARFQNPENCAKLTKSIKQSKTIPETIKQIPKFSTRKKKLKEILLQEV